MFVVVIVVFRARERREAGRGRGGRGTVTRPDTTTLFLLSKLARQRYYFYYGSVIVAVVLKAREPRAIKASVMRYNASLEWRQTHDWHLYHCANKITRSTKVRVRRGMHASNGSLRRIPPPAQLPLSRPISYPIPFKASPHQQCVPRLKNLPLNPALPSCLFYIKNGVYKNVS